MPKNLLLERTFEEIAAVVWGWLDDRLLVAHDGLEGGLQGCSPVLVVYVEPEHNLHFSAKA